MFHLYEDNTQIYLPVKPLQMDVAAAVERIEGRVAEIRAWVSSNFLKLNDDKTEVIIFYLHLRNIATIMRYLTPSATEQIAYAFVISRLDVGNAVPTPIQTNRTTLKTAELGGPPRG